MGGGNQKSETPPVSTLKDAAAQVAGKVAVKAATKRRQRSWAPQLVSSCTGAALSTTGGPAPCCWAGSTTGPQNDRAAGQQGSSRRTLACLESGHGGDAAGRRHLLHLVHIHLQGRAQGRSSTPPVEQQPGAAAAGQQGPAPGAPRPRASGCRVRRTLDQAPECESSHPPGLYQEAGDRQHPCP